MRQRCLLILAAAIAFVPSAFGAARLFVSPDGLDTNPCTLTQPCRSFQIAANTAGSGGEVVALGSAGYGTVILPTNGISLIAPEGVYAGISSSGGDAIAFGGLGAGTVVLRGLTITGVGTGNGVNASACNLHVENCIITGFSTGLAMSANAHAYIRSTVIRGCGTGMFGFQAVINADDVHLERNAIGLDAESTTATLRNTFAAGNTTVGFRGVLALQNFPTVVTLEFCTAANNATGIDETNASIVLSNCTITGNTDPLVGTGGIVYTRGNNTVAGNTHAIAASLTTLNGQ